MAERTQTIRTWKRASMVLANTEVAEKGNLACIDLSTGEVVAGQEDTGLFPIGFFDENLTGNGTLQVGITLFKEITLHRMVNSSGDPVAAADVGNIVFVEDSQTVSKTDNTGARSASGRLWAVTSAGALVEMGAA